MKVFHLARWSTIILDAHKAFHLNFNTYFSIKLKKILQLKMDSSRKKIQNVILEDITMILAFSNTFFHRKTLVKEDGSFRCLYPFLFTLNNKAKLQKT